MKTYECTPAFGWGIAGPAIVGICRKLAELGLENSEPPRFATLRELVSPFPVKVTGDDAAVLAFAEWMNARGHDGRPGPVEALLS